MSLWLTITLLLLVAALFIAVPFYIGRNRELEVELFNVAEQANIDVFRDQQAQYQQQFEGGEISAEQQALMLAEAEQLLLSNTASVRQQQDTRQGLWLLPILIIVMSLASIFIYRSLGSAVDQQITESLAEQQSQWTPELIATIGERAKQRPNNVYYWTILAEEAMGRGDMVAAEGYFAEAIRVQPNESYLLGQYAQALFFVEENRFSATVIAAVDRAFAVDSSNQTVLGLKGIQAFQEADYRRAITYWQGAASGLNPASDSWLALQNGIQQAQQLAGEAPSESDDFRLMINLSIDPSIQYSPHQLVFVAIIEADGPPMPVAARKLAASQLPLALELSDRDVLMAGRSLADAGKIKVVARLSSSGSATPQEGDWQVVSDIIDGRSGTLNLSLSIATPFRR
jgi:cytochrome c-type biogenesis protein CcmH